ncbi:hypothetical protein IWX75_003535 [Arthrobacter sp. CAN_A6]
MRSVQQPLVPADKSEYQGTMAKKKGVAPRLADALGIILGTGRFR